MADRYWVGGSGTWDASTTTNWSATSGGAGGASAPTSADNVFFNSASSGGTYTVSTSGSPVCADISIAAPASGTFTLTGSVGVGVYGSWTSVATNVSWTMPVSFLGSATSTITTNGLTLAGGVTLNRVGGSLQLQGNISTLSFGTFALTAGTLDLNGFNISCNFFNTSSNAVRVLAFGTGGTITCPNTTGGFVWNGSDATNFSWTGTGNANFTYAGSSGSRIINHGSTGGSEATKAPPFNISAGSDTIGWSLGNSYFSDLNTSGFSGTLNGAVRFIYGNLTLGSNTVLQPSSDITTFAGTSGTKTITTGNVLIDIPVTFNGTGSNWQLQDDWTSAVGNGTITLTGGNIDLNGKNFTIKQFLTSGTNVRGIVANGGNLNIFHSNITVWSGGTSTNANFAGLVANFTYSGNAGTRTATLGSLVEANAVSVRVSAGSDSFTLGGSSNDVDFTGFSGTLTNSTRIMYGNLTLSPTMTVTAASGSTTSLLGVAGTKTITTNGTTAAVSFTINAPTGTYRLADNFNMWNGSASTLFSLTSGNLDLNDQTLTTGIFGTSGSVARTIQFGNAGVINVAGSGLAVWNASSAGNFIYTGTPNVNFTTTANTGTRVFTHGTLGGTFPQNLPPPWKILGGTDTVVVTTNSRVNDIDFTGFGGNLTNTTRNFYGNVTFSPTMSAANGALVTTFISNATQTFDTAGLTTDFPITIGNAIGNIAANIFSTGTVVLANALTMGNSRVLTVNSGTLDANNYNITTGRLSTSGNVTRSIDISNTTLDLTGNGTVFNAAISSNLTLNTANSTVLLSDDTTTFRIFVTGDQTYNNVIIGGNTATSNTSFTGNGVFNTISSTKTVPHQVIFTAGSTTTVDAFEISGTAGNVVTITSDTANVHNLVYTGAGNVDVSWANISYSNASPANTWYALLTNNNTNNGNNTGWIFSTGPGPVSSSNFFLLF